MIPRPRTRAPWRRTLPAPLLACALSLTLTLALLVPPASAAPAEPSDDIADRIEAIPGMRIIEEKDTEPGFRYFVLGYRQPADHDDPGAATFEQRLTLLHRGLDRPTVLHTSGYDVSTEPSRAEPTRIVDGNQVSTEQRFFEPSRPDPADWDDLDIRQAAEDHHRIVAALNGVYDRAWLSTGASKGGMTSVYHRRFHPGDIDGTVAYVAPNDVHDHADSAYLRFFDEVGGSDHPTCQRDLQDLQQEALRRRGALVEHYERLAQEHGWTFDRTIGSSDAAFEMLVLDSVYVFWQYQPPERCDEVPTRGASTDEIAAFLDDVAGFEFYTDQGTDPYIPYYYQAATQLGTPSVPTKHLKGQLRHPGLYDARSYLPDDMDLPAFDHRAMPDIDRWVRTRSSQMLLVDGEFDPWSAEPFRVADGGARDTMRLVAPGANHGADIEMLEGKDRETATDAVQRWAGASGRPVERVPALDDAGDRQQDEERQRPG